MEIIPRKFYLDDLFDSFLEGESRKMTCDIYEKEGNYHLEMDLPGFTKEDIKIHCDNGNLTVTAEKGKEEKEEDKKYIRRERSYGKYSRSFYLGNIDEENISAEFKNGTLTVMVPKLTENDSKKMIEIK